MSMRLSTPNLTVAIAHVSQGEIFNIATGHSISLIELIEQLKQEYPAYREINFEPARAGDLKNSQADCSKYRALANHHYRQTSIDSCPKSPI